MYVKIVIGTGGPTLENADIIDILSMILSSDGKCTKHIFKCRKLVEIMLVCHTLLTSGSEDSPVGNHMPPYILACIRVQGI